MEYYNNIQDVEIFKPDYIYNIKFLGCIKEPFDSVIFFYFQSHKKYYELMYLNNYPSDSFIQCKVCENTDELTFFDDEENDYYVIPEQYRNIKIICLDDIELKTNIFTLSLESMDINKLQKGETNLKIDDSFKIDRSMYYDIKKEFFNHKDNDKKINR